MGFGDRAQSVFDFSVGVSLFVIVVFGVFLFVPSVLGASDVDATGGPEALAAERSAEYLAGSVLAPANDGVGSWDGPHEFRRECVLLFFGAAPGNPDVGSVTDDDCGFDSTAPLANRAGLSETTGVSITLEGDLDGDPQLDRLCWIEASDSLEVQNDGVAPACDGSPDNVVFTAGPGPAANTDFALAKRYGRLDGRRLYLHVRVW